MRGDRRTSLTQDKSSRHPLLFLFCFLEATGKMGIRVRGIFGDVKVWIAAACAAAFAVLPGASQAVTSHFADRVVAGGIAPATAMAIAPDGRIFVSQQTGTIRVISRGALLGTPFATLMVDSQGERGLLGIAFDPDFAHDHYVYAYYTVPGSLPHNRVIRLTAGGNTAVAGSEKVIFDLSPLGASTSHNGGALHFGADGKLYIASGDNAHSANAQMLTNLLGKVLRINPTGTIPSDNPFFNQVTGKNRAIWAYGLRNPFTFGVEPGSGRIFVDDVGKWTWEEINVGAAGCNYGWPDTEGPTGNPAFCSPLYWYGHGTTPSTGCAITGGTFYTPDRQQFPAGFRGNYFFTDLCGGWIRRLDPSDPSRSAPFTSGISRPVDLAVGSDGSLYYLARGTSEVHRITYLAAPKITGFTPSSGPVGTWVKISGTGLGAETSVLFGGQPAATVNVQSDDGLWTKVPPGAVSSPITVTTPAGQATSSSVFSVG